jgi:DNA-binding protein HU-beta
MTIENSINWIETIIKRNEVKNVCVGNIAIIHLDCTRTCKKLSIEHTTKCNKKARYDAVILSIRTLKALGKRSGHRNAVLVDHGMKTYERFEPYGSYSSIDDVVDFAMEHDFRDIFNLHNYTYIPPSNFCPRLGPQKYVKGTHFSKTCAFWSLWYLEERLINPDKSQSQILQELLKHFDQNGPNYAVDFIQSYIDKLNRHNVYIHHQYSNLPKSAKRKSNAAKKPSSPKRKSNAAKKPSSPKQKSNAAKKRASPKQKSKATEKRASPKRKSKATKKRASPKQKSNAAKKPSPKQKSKATEKRASPKRKSKATKKRASPKRKSNQTKKRASPKQKSNPTKKRASPKRKINATKKRASPKQKSNATKKRASPKQKSEAAKKRASPKQRGNATKKRT